MQAAGLGLGRRLKTASDPRNILADGAFLTAGGAHGTASSGTIGAGWISSRSIGSGATVTTSIDTSDAAELPVQVQSVSGAAAGDHVTLVLNTTLSALGITAPGEYWLNCELAFANTANLRAFWMRARLAMSPNHDSEAFTEDTTASAAITPPDGVYQVALISVPAGAAGSTQVNIQFWRKYLAAGAGDLKVRAVSVMEAA